jgi:hypothetical protein
MEQERQSRRSLAEKSLHEVVRHATAADGSDVGYTFNFAVQSEGDARKLHPRSRRVDRKESAR